MDTVKGKISSNCILFETDVNANNNEKQKGHRGLFPQRNANWSIDFSQFKVNPLSGNSLTLFHHPKSK